MKLSYKNEIAHLQMLQVLHWQMTRIRDLKREIEHDREAHDEWMLRFQGHYRFVMACVVLSHYGRWMGWHKN